MTAGDANATLARPGDDHRGVRGAVEVASKAFETREKMSMLRRQRFASECVHLPLAYMDAESAVRRHRPAQLPRASTPFSSSIPPAKSGKQRRTIPLWTIPLALVTGNTLNINPSERDPAATIIKLCVRAGACASPYSPFPPNILSPFLITLQPIPSSVFHSKQLTSTLTVKYAPSSSLFHLVTYLTDGCKGLPPGALNVVHSAVPTSSWPGMARGRTYTSWARRTGSACRYVYLQQDHAVVMPDANKDQARPRNHRLITSADNAGPENGKIWVDGREVQVPGYPAGNWVGATIIEVGSTELATYKEEIFGPVLCVLSVPTLNAAIAVLNANPFGNGAAIFTQNPALHVEAGQIGMNVPIPVPLPMFSWTGNKVRSLSVLPFFTPRSFVVQVERDTINLTRLTAQASFLGDINFYGKG
ncbi:Aldehyde/histidinol dehydrogenase [Mycena galopus ATCC 62051]|nr:Aldehyde/histidinol dehydrogenase [Mycena galopus ATCC 62051]